MGLSENIVVMDLKGKKSEVSEIIRKDIEEYLGRGGVIEPAEEQESRESFAADAHMGGLYGD